MNLKSVTCSFKLDRKIYNAYKSIVVANGENVKGNLVRYMLSVIDSQTKNTTTTLPLEETENLKDE